MDSPIILKAKKRVFTEAVQEFCNIQNLPMPEINFDGTDDGGGNQLAHSHPEFYKICISARQLKMQKSSGLRETAYHEMTHLIGLIEHGSEFEDKKNELMHKGWKPPRSTGFISGETVNEESKRIRDDPQKFAKINEDSAFLKFLESKETSEENQTNRQKELEKTRERLGINLNDKSHIRPQKKDRKRARKPARSDTMYDHMGNDEIEKTRERLEIDLKDKSHIQPKKKPGLLDRIKDALGILD